MKKVLIINGHQFYDGVARGKLTKHYIDNANDFFIKNGFEVKYTHLEKGYDNEEEMQKVEWADYIFLQYPVFWMSLPWLAKKYIDETFIHGRHYASDGRSRKDGTKHYGSDGLLKGKKYMLSLTYNTPLCEFDNKDGFFDGLTLDEANVAVHKIFQFCGVEPLETYSVHEVLKEGSLDVEKETERFNKLLNKNFIA